MRAKGLSWGPFTKAGVELVLHEFFLDAPSDVLDDLAGWLRSGKRARAACGRLDHWIQTAVRDLPPTAPRRTPVRTRGKHHDLEALLAGLLAEEFAGEFAGEAAAEDSAPAIPTITWGRQGPSKRPRNIRLGSYQAEGNLIRIHPKLDREAVPHAFVRYIVFHECLHALYPSKRDTAGRWIHHTRAFRARERTYRDYLFALEWEKSTLFSVI
ncbi:MAG: hypothetical protein R3F17_11750 [Planctomycetota bacterium]